MTGLQTMVRQFHRAMGQVDPTTPVSDPTFKTRMLRARICAEEFAELVVALVGSDYAGDLFDEMITKVCAKRGNWDPGDLVEITDATSDCRVVAAGTDEANGVNGEPIDIAVMQKNLLKVGGGRDEHGKFQKPPGWTPPDIAGLLRAQGWKP